MTYVAEVLADNPTVYWRFEEGGGATTAADTSGNNNTGTITNGPIEGVAGLISVGTCFTFSAPSAQDVHSAAIPAINSLAGWTIEAWIKTTSVLSNVMICGSDAAQRYLQFRTTTGGVAAELIAFSGASSGTKTGAITINDGVRHHVVGTAIPGFLNLYVDGVQDGAAGGGPGGATMQTANSGLYVGQRGQGSLYFTGSIDEFAFYPSVLSLTRIQAHYNAGIAGGVVANQLQQLAPLNVTRTFM